MIARSETWVEKEEKAARVVARVGEDIAISIWRYCSMQMEATVNSDNYCQR